MKTKRKQKLAWLLIVPIIGISAATVSFTNQTPTPYASKQAVKGDDFVRASFKGGMDEYIAYFVKEMKYPKKAKESGKEGKVIVAFTVDANGKVEHVKIKESSNSIFDKEALRVTKQMPNWNPATKNGSPVKSEMAIPIVFKLQK